MANPLASQPASLTPSWERLGVARIQAQTSPNATILGDSCLLEGLHDRLRKEAHSKQNRKMTNIVIVHKFLIAKGNA